jgi:hypothetical protein
MDLPAINNTPMKYRFLITILCLHGTLFAQSPKADTVEVELGKSSKMVLMVHDSADIELLREYDYNELFDDILHQLGSDHPDMDPEEEDSMNSQENNADDRDDEWGDSHDGEEDDWDNEEERDHEDQYPCSSTNFMMFDFGLNNWLQTGGDNGDADPIYSVRPWGSWYVGINLVEELRLSNQFSLNFRAGLSVYNFKFDENDVLMTKTPDGVVFSHDPRPLDFTKSKLTESHVNFGFMAVFNSRNFDHRHGRFHWHHGGFRLGIGPYVGYRLDSYNKLQYEEEDGDKENERNRSNFHLNNFRYGARLMIGIRDVDFFFQYDINELFKDDKGPRLNAYSFGISF